MNFRTASKRPSTLALAFALAAGGLVASSAIATPAVAQDKEEKAEKPNYSRSFVKAYTPINERINAEGADLAAIKAELPKLLEALETADDRNAAGGLLYNLGAKTDDSQLMVRGLDMMLDSGRLAPEQVGQFNWTAYQLNQQLGNTEAAREALEGAIAANYSFDAQMSDGSSRRIGPDDLRMMVADLYFEAEDYAPGFAYLDEQIAERREAGGKVPESWLKTAFVTAFNNDLTAETSKYSVLYVSEYPSKTSWGDAIAVALGAQRYEYPEILDILRLVRRTDTFRTSNMYLEYIEAADPRKLPGEVQAIIDEGYASGMLDKTDSFVSESRAEATRRIEADKQDLPVLAKDARASGAPLKTVMAAGDAFLSYGRMAEAEEFYSKAMTMAGANTPLVLTRLGIAQVEQGKYAEAQATFNKVEGARQAIANLWGVYAAQQNTGG